MLVLGFYNCFRELQEDVSISTEKPKQILRETTDKMTDNEKTEESWFLFLRMNNSYIVDIL